LAKLKRHEANHVRAAWLNSGKVLSAIRASSCENVEAAAQAVIVDITQIGIEYDRTSKHGRSEGVTFP
jgi:predicted secreted Zn-dependent protease